VWCVCIHWARYKVWTRPGNTHANYPIRHIRYRLDTWIKQCSLTLYWCHWWLDWNKCSLANAVSKILYITENHMHLVGYYLKCNTIHKHIDQWDINILIFQHTIVPDLCMPPAVAWSLNVRRQYCWNIVLHVCLIAKAKSMCVHLSACAFAYVRLCVYVWTCSCMCACVCEGSSSSLLESKISLQITMH
jgi:hypothetical protein